jgi:pyruvate kinase
MIDNPFPTRAEASDVANAVIDGTSAVMLSAETAVGRFPVEAVATMNDLVLAAERDPSVYRSAISEVAERTDVAVMRAAVSLGSEVEAAAIVVPSSSGDAARACARYRPNRPILALADERRVANQLNLEWGIVPALFEFEESVEELIEAALEQAARLLVLEPGQRLVISAGPGKRSGETNLITLRVVP